MFYHGGCLCGNIRYQIAGEARDPHTCSCRFCQRHSGSLTQMWIEFDEEQVVWNGEGGMPALWRSSETSSRAFCRICGSTIGAIDDTPTLAIAVGTLDNPDQPELRPQYHTFEDCRPQWWHLEDQ